MQSRSQWSAAECWKNFQATGRWLSLLNRHYALCLVIISFSIQVRESLKGQTNGKSRKISCGSRPDHEESVSPTLAPVTSSSSRNDGLSMSKDQTLRNDWICVFIIYILNDQISRCHSVSGRIKCCVIWTGIAKSIFDDNGGGDDHDHDECSRNEPPTCDYFSQKSTDRSSGMVDRRCYALPFLNWFCFKRSCSTIPQTCKSSTTDHNHNILHATIVFNRVEIDSQTTCSYFPIVCLFQEKWWPFC